MDFIEKISNILLLNSSLYLGIFLVFLIALLLIIFLLKKLCQYPVVQQQVNQKKKFINPCKIDVFNQSFALPEKLIEHITQQPSSPKAWIKLIQTCKHFFGSNPILVVNKFESESSDSFPVVNLNNQSLVLQTIDFEPCKLWLMGSLNIFKYEDSQVGFDFSVSEIVSDLIPHIYKCGLRKFEINDQELSFEEFQILTKEKTLRLFLLNDSVITYDDGKIVPLEVILEALPGIKAFYLTNSYKFITPETSKNLLTLSKLKNFTLINLSGLQNNLDPDSFVQFLKNQKLQHIYLYFTNTASPKYIDTFVAVMKEYTQNEENQQFISHLEVYHKDDDIFKYRFDMTF